MTWTLPALWADLSTAWAPENLPYTVAFWLAVGGIVWFVSRKRRGATADRDEP